MDPKMDAGWVTRPDWTVRDDPEEPDAQQEGASEEEPDAQQEGASEEEHPPAEEDQGDAAAGEEPAAES